MPAGDGAAFAEAAPSLDDKTLLPEVTADQEHLEMGVSPPTLHEEDGVENGLNAQAVKSMEVAAQMTEANSEGHDDEPAAELAPQPASSEKRSEASVALNDLAGDPEAPELEENQAEAPEMELEAPAAEAEESVRGGFPLARVKKIIRFDDDIRQVSNEAARLVNIATEFFLEALVSAAHSVAVERKRKGVNREDILRAVKAKRKFRECIGDSLKESGRSEKEGNEGDTLGDSETHIKHRPKQKAKAPTKPPPKSRLITGFFLKNS